MLVWVILAIAITFSLIACVTTIMIGAKRAPKKLPAHLLPLQIVAVLMLTWDLEGLPVPSAVDMAVRIIGAVLVYYVLYRSAPWLRDVYGKSVWWKR